LIAFLTILAPAVSASPYYTVQEVSDNYRLPDRTWDSTPIEQSKLPGVYGTQGAVHPVRMFFPMRAGWENSYGTLIGGVPDGHSYAMPYSSMELGYTQKQADGSYGPFIGVIDQVPYGALMLNDKNQLLAIGPLRNELIDLNTHSTTNVSDLISPTDWSKYAGDLFYASGLGNDGSILGYFEGAGGQDYHPVLLTPPSVTPESPVPEPSTFIVFAAAILALATANKVRGRCGQTL
jgi:hypothetical protein